MPSVAPDTPGRMSRVPQYGPPTPISTNTPVPPEVGIESPDVEDNEAGRLRQRALAERLLLGALRERDTAKRAVEAEGRARFLASAGRELAMALDRGVIREIVQRSALPRAGSWCIVDLVEVDGSIHRLAAVHPDPAKDALARSLEDSRHPGSDEILGAPSAAVLREIGFGELLRVPLIVGDSVLGAITFVTRADDPPLSAEEIRLASDLAEQCAMALDNARLYAKADELRAAADAANREKTVFLGNITHELLTPLNAIGGYADIMEMELHGPVTPEQRADLERIKHSQQHLVALISGILEYVHSESGRIEYRPARVPVEPLLREVADMLSSAATLKELALDVRPCDEDVAIWADPVRVRQILVNLVTNAVKYSPTGGGGIVLSSTAAPDVVRVHVSDAGPGIPSEKLASIFEPFVQLTPGLGDRQGGVGLGLAISRDLARGMSGRLTVESTLGVGSRFTLELPRARRSIAEST